MDRLIKKLKEEDDLCIHMVGLQGAGKLTILHKLIYGDNPAETSCGRFNEYSMTCKNLTFAVSDVRGQDKKHELKLSPNTRGLIFVLDSSDRKRADEAGSELNKILTKDMLQDELRDAALLILANKKDLPNTMDNNHIMEKLGLKDLPPQRQWFIGRTCATTGVGISEGLDWLVKAMEMAKRKFKCGDNVEFKHFINQEMHIWVPAVVIDDEMDRDGTVNLEYTTNVDDRRPKVLLQSKRTPDKVSSKRILYLDIRDAPQASGFRNFKYMERVDVILECGWCPGIINEVRSGNMYAVLLHGKVKDYFYHTSIRPAIDDGVWKQEKESMSESLNVEKSLHEAEESDTSSD